MATTKPYIQAACICENVLFDKDDVASLIRILDSFVVEIPDNVPAGMPYGFPITMFVRLTFDELKEGTLSIQPNRPDGTLGTRQNIPIPESNVHKNVQFKTGFHILSPQAGNYRFDLFWNEEFLTAVFATVTIKQTQEPGASRQA